MQPPPPPPVSLAPSAPAAIAAWHISSSRAVESSSAAEQLLVQHHQLAEAPRARRSASALLPFVHQRFDAVEDSARPSSGRARAGGAIDATVSSVLPRLAAVADDERELARERERLERLALAELRDAAARRHRRVDAGRVAVKDALGGERGVGDRAAASRGRPSAASIARTIATLSAAEPPRPALAGSSMRARTRSAGRCRVRVEQRAKRLAQLLGLLVALHGVGVERDAARSRPRAPGARPVRRWPRPRAAARRPAPAGRTPRRVRRARSACRYRSRDRPTSRTAVLASPRPRAQALTPALPDLPLLRR